MNGFIELHVADTQCPVLVNLDHVQQILEAFGRATLFFDFQSNGSGEYDYLRVTEDLEDVKRLIKEMAK